MKFLTALVARALGMVSIWLGCALNAGFGFSAINAPRYAFIVLWAMGALLLYAELLLRNDMRKSGRNFKLTKIEDIILSVGGFIYISNNAVMILFTHMFRYNLAMFLFISFVLLAISVFMTIFYKCMIYKKYGNLG